MSNKTKINKDSIDCIIENTFNHIKDIVDANTVVGNIIDLGNKMFIIPVSRISVGMVSGGGVPSGKKNINAGSGTGFNIEPIGFITIANLNFDFLPVNTTADISKNLIDSLVKVYEKVISEKKDLEDEE